MMPDEPENPSAGAAADPEPNLPRLLRQPTGHRPIDLRQGARQVSMAALREQIAARFLAETSETALLAETDQGIRERIREVAEYELEIAVIRLTRPEKNALVDSVFSDLFGFGPLDGLLAQAALREIAIDGPDRVFIQVGTEERKPGPFTFESLEQLEGVVARLLKPTGTAYSEAQPFVEVARRLHDRRVRILVAAPPASPILTVELRLHPVQRPQIEDLIAVGAIDTGSAERLRAHIAGHRGLLILGDVGSGKTTLLQALLPLLPAHTAVVQRAEECDVPDDQVSLSGPDFDVAIRQGAGLQPPWLVLDEVRLDEGAALLETLIDPPASGANPVYLWALRGTTRGDRLVASFSMALRRARPDLDQAAIVGAIVQAFPLIVAMGRRGGQPGVIGLYGWKLEPDRTSLIPLDAG